MKSIDVFLLRVVKRLTETERRGKGEVVCFLGFVTLLGSDTAAQEREDDLLSVRRGLVRERLFEDWFL
jgi:hypothetical protein